MTDSVAEDMLHLADHIEALYRSRMRSIHISLTGHEPPDPGYPNASIPVMPPLRGPRGAGVEIAQATYWLDVCAKLTRRASDFDAQTRRGFTIACGLLGLNWNDTQKAISAARASGVQEAARVWAAHMSEPKPRLIGSVYVAIRVGAPDVVKVGFSTKLARRMRQLSRIEGAAVNCIHHRPGTMLHEWALHADLGPEVKSEWYPRSAIPTWLLQGAKMREAA